MPRSLAFQFFFLNIFSKEQPGVHKSLRGGGGTDWPLPCTLVAIRRTEIQVDPVSEPSLGWRTSWNWSQRARLERSSRIRWSRMLADCWWPCWRFHGMLTRIFVVGFFRGWLGHDCLVYSSKMIESVYSRILFHRGLHGLTWAASVKIWAPWWTYFDIFRQTVKLEMPLCGTSIRNMSKFWAGYLKQRGRNLLTVDSNRIRWISNEYKLCICQIPIRFRLWDLSSLSHDSLGGFSGDTAVVGIVWKEADWVCASTGGIVSPSSESLWTLSVFLSISDGDEDWVWYWSDNVLAAVQHRWWARSPRRPLHERPQTHFTMSSFWIGIFGSGFMVMLKVLALPVTWLHLSCVYSMIIVWRRRNRWRESSFRACTPPSMAAECYEVSIT